MLTLQDSVLEDGRIRRRPIEEVAHGSEARLRARVWDETALFVLGRSSLSFTFSPLPEEERLDIVRVLLPEISN